MLDLLLGNHDNSWEGDMDWRYVDSRVKPSAAYTYVVS